MIFVYILGNNYFYSIYTVNQLFIDKLSYDAFILNVKIIPYHVIQNKNSIHSQKKLYELKMF